MVKKALPVRKGEKPKVQKAKPKKKNKKKKKRNLSTEIARSISETLQLNSWGEFDLPSVLTRYTSPSDPRYHLGLHREVLIPERQMPIYEPNHFKAKQVFNNQASIVMRALDDEFPVREKEFDLILCEECENG
jgi:hypothetical protein